MNDITPEEQKELWKFMGEMEGLSGDIKSLKDDMKTMKDDVQSIKVEFANLKGKLFAVAGIITLAWTAIWGFLKGAFS